jgi:Flp pilus assembly protein TadG
MTLAVPATSPHEIKTSKTLRQSGQAMILFAILLPVLMGILGLAVEGGRVWVEYRKMQAAADLAALVGAQKLPCGLSDSTCMSAAATLACTYAANNGFSGCVSQGTSGQFAHVPPVTCSPYDFLDYGNDSTAANPTSCKATTRSLAFQDYIEVNLTDSLGTIPIFNVPVTLGTHAVARHGEPSTKDFAVSVLDPSPQQSNSAMVIGGSLQLVINGITFSNGGINVNGLSTPAKACDGGWESATVQGDPGHLTNYTGVTPSFAPPDCKTYSGSAWVTPAADASNNFSAGLPQITDPYCTSLSPPYNGAKGTDCNNTTPASSIADANWPYTTMPNCPDCNFGGFWYDGTNWFKGGSPSANNTNHYIELFPGVYDSMDLGSSDHAYFNPGVYTFTGTIKQGQGLMCVYGSPSCNSSYCPAQNFDPNDSSTTAPYSTTGDKWYYLCSPWGVWDKKLPRPSSGNGLANTTSSIAGLSNSVGCGVGVNFGPCTVAPTFWNNATRTSSTIPLNGVTFYFPLGSGGIQNHGAGNSTGAVSLAFPNPCPGNGKVNYSASPISTTGGNGFDSSPLEVQFPQGSSSAYYTYDNTSTNTLALQRNGGTSWQTQTTDNVYPSFDLTLNGECTPNTYEVWPGEMPIGQHLHYLFFSRNLTGNGNNGFHFVLNGNTLQNWYGSFYTPNALEDITGSGAGAAGPPFIAGQIVTWDLKFSGSAAVDLIYRPCGIADVCASGLGTQIVQ